MRVYVSVCECVCVCEKIESGLCVVCAWFVQRTEEKKRKKKKKKRRRRKRRRKRKKKKKEKEERRRRKIKHKQNPPHAQRVPPPPPPPLPPPKKSSISRNLVFGSTHTHKNKPKQGKRAVVWGARGGRGSRRVVCGVCVCVRGVCV